MSMIVRDGFTNSKGTYYDKVRETALKKGELAGNLGKFVAESHCGGNMFFSSSNEPSTGVYIYQSNINPNVGYRIYKEFNDYGFNGYSDDNLIQKLQERQPNIKLTQFPCGVVTMDGKIIGQEIVYFLNDITVYELFKQYYVRDSIKVYQAILDVLKEMYDNGIVYLDNHPKNFMLDFRFNGVKIDTIDFDSTYVKFDDQSGNARKQLFDNYTNMVNVLNRIIEVDSRVGEFKLTSSFDEAYDQLHTMKRKLSK